MAHGTSLVCGQGRLEAFQSLGQREIPALVVEADSDDCLVMSLVENVRGVNIGPSICFTT